MILFGVIQAKTSSLMHDDINQQKNKPENPFQTMTSQKIDLILFISSRVELKPIQINIRQLITDWGRRI